MNILFFQRDSRGFFKKNILTLCYISKKVQRVRPERNKSMTDTVQQIPEYGKTFHTGEPGPEQYFERHNRTRRITDSDHRGNDPAAVIEIPQRLKISGKIFMDIIPVSHHFFYEHRNILFPFQSSSFYFNLLFFSSVTARN